jgi:hypothetical protein
VVISSDAFVDSVFQIAKELGYPVKLNRDRKMQIYFPNKKALHEEHLRMLYPDILLNGAQVHKLIKAVAPGRPCSHRPMREIIAQLHDRK